MTTYILDAEWEVEEGDDVVLGAKRLHCIVLSEFRGDSIIMFADSSAAANNLNEFKPWLAQQDNITVVAHNLLSADLEVFRRLLGIPFTVGPDTIMSKKCFLSWIHFR